MVARVAGAGPGNGDAVGDDERRAPSRPRAWFWRAALALVALVALAGLSGLAVIAARGVGWVRALGRPAPPTVTHELVVERLRDVAKLVTTEMTVRDVVTYEQTRFVFQKRALLVVTGTILAGIDLKQGSDVRIDHRAKLITIMLPRATILAVDVTDVHTYDEHAGLLNPFRPEDRDAIQHLVRQTLVAAGERSGLLQHADSSARAVLRELLARDGYSVLVLSPRDVLRLPGG